MTHQSPAKHIYGVHFACLSVVCIAEHADSHGIRRASWLKRWLCDSQGSGSNLGWDINYPDWSILLFFSVPPSTCQDGVINWASTTSPPFSLHHSTIVLKFVSTHCQLPAATLNILHASALKREAICSSETSVTIYRTTSRHIPKDSE
jgi:hypothetical protein